MTISVNNVQIGVSGDSYTPPSAVKAGLLVIVGSEDLDGDNPITAVTFDGNALTAIASSNADPDGLGHVQRQTHYLLVNPGTASGVIAITGGEAGRTGFIACTLGNLDQASPYVNHTPAFNNSSGDETVSHTTGANASLVISSAIHEENVELSVNAGVPNFAAQLGVIQVHGRMGAHYEESTSAQTLNYQWTLGASGRFSLIAVEYLEASASLDAIADQELNVGDVVNIPLTYSGTVAEPVSYNITGLPGGLSESGGAITGTVTTFEYTTVSVELLDSGAQSIDTKTFNVLVLPAGSVGVVSTVDYAGLNEDSPFIQLINDSDLSVGDIFVYPAVVDSRNITIDSDGLVTVSGTGDITIPNVYILDASNSYAAVGPASLIGNYSDVVPDQFTLIADITGADPLAYFTGSFVVAGIDAGQDVTFYSINMQVSTTGNVGTYGSSVVRQAGDTVSYRIQASPAHGTPKTGTILCNGVSDSVTVTTRASNAPAVTTQPAAQSVIEGAQATFTAIFSGADSQQWFRYVDGVSDVSLTGETGTTLTITAALSDSGNQYYCVGTNGDGSTQTNLATLTVTGAATNVEINIDDIRNINTGVAQASVSLAVAVFAPDDLQTPILSTTITTDGSADGVISSTDLVLGSVGNSVLVEFTENQSGQRHLYPFTIEAAA